MSGNNGDNQEDRKQPVHLRVSTKRRLLERGSMHDTFDTVIARVLDQLEAFEAPFVGSSTRT